MIPYNTPASVNYNGLDNKNFYDFPFRVERDADLRLSVYDALNEATELVLNVDYTYTKLPFPRTGGVITLVDLAQAWVTDVTNPDGAGKLKSGYTIFISFKSMPDQLTPFTDLNSQTPIAIEKALDRMAMNLVALKDNISRALQVPEGGGTGGSDGVEFPPLPGNANKVLAVNADASGFTYGPTTDSIFAAAVAADNSATDSLNYSLDSANFRNQSEGFSLASLGYRDQSMIYRDDTAILKGDVIVLKADTFGFRNEAEGFRDAAEVQAIMAEEASERQLYKNLVIVSSVDSPINLTSLSADTMYSVDASLGAVSFYLPQMSGVPDNFKVGIVKTDISANLVTVYRTFTDTINDGASIAVKNIHFGFAVFANNPSTNWEGRFFTLIEGSGGGGVPDGGDTGAALVKASVANQDAVWDDMIFDGYSARFSKAWYSQGLRQTLAMILELTYLGPLIASFTGSSNILREKGVVVASVVLSANVTKRSNAIARIHFKQGATTIQDYAPPAIIGSGVTTANYSTSFTDNITFTVEVTDAIVGVDGPTMVSSTVTYSFVYPYFHGCAAPARTPAQVTTLTKSVINSTATLNRTFTSLSGDVYYFAYPASYGVLSSILDENGFENISAWTKTVSNVTAFSGDTVSYNIYESNNPVVAGSTNFTFKR